MEQRAKITIFHLYRKDGTALFLHPFVTLDKLLSVLQKADLEGKYGAEPRVESLTLFRNDLYRMIEAAVKSWVAEARFIPRFLFSSAAFLLVYVFLSVAVRDPIPIIDEVLFGLGAAVAVYVYMSRRDQRSSAALRKRVELRAIVDRIVFLEDRFVRQVEEALQMNESESREKVLHDMLAGIERTFSIVDEREAQQLAAYLEKRFNSREYRKQEKLLVKAGSGRSLIGNVESLSRWCESKKIDLSLFDVYRRIKKSYRRVS